MNTIMMAKSQDVVVLLKWLCCPMVKSYADLASELGMSVGEVHGATQRAAQSGLFDLESKRPRMNALREYLAIDWTAAGAATVIDCWRALPEPARRQVGRYQPLGQAADGDVAEWLGRKAGRQFDLLTN